MIIKEALSFDDVLLVPCYTEVRSRSIPDLSSYVAGVRLTTPIISSPMDTVTEATMAIAVGKMGGMGIIHRFMSPSDQIDNLRSVEREERSSGASIPKVFAIGVGKEELSRFKEVYHSVPVDAVAIDVANGHSSYMREMIHQIRDVAPDIQIIAGNVATGEGFMHLAESGANAVRIGIGSGAICSTRIQTAFGVPALQSVMDAYYVKQRNPHFQNVAIIADGGIRYPGDFVKALAAGADAIMCGRILAQTEESPGTPVWDDNAGIMKKPYRGMACYSSDTEVLTKDGWVSFESLDSNSSIATLNKETKNIEYQNPIGLFKYRYSGAMFRVDSKYVNLLVTPNHNLYIGKRNHHRKTQYHLIKAEDAYSESNKHKNYKYRLSGNWTGTTVDNFIIPNTNISFSMNDWLDFYGFWLAEGCTYQYKQKKIYTCNVTSISNNDLDLILRYQNILSKSGIRSSIRSRVIASGKTNYELKCHNKELHNYLSKFGKAKDKYIAREFMSLSKEQVNIIIDSVFLGDGSKARGTISTTSRRLADDLSELSIKTGRNGNFYTSRLKGVNYGKFKRNYDLLQVSVMGSVEETLVDNKNVSKEEYDGYVYCAEVENSVICVRRGGKHVWCGNSSEVQQDKRGGLKPMTCAEGVSTTLPVIGSVRSVIEEFAGGLRSGMTYANATTLAKLRTNATFIKITSAGLSESHAFGTRKE